jgi:F-type H+-transporting ATPase subunit gamma
MPSLKDLRKSIVSVKATQKITKAMQMVAASKLRRAQAAAEAARPYAERMEKVLANLAAEPTSRVQAPELLAGTGRSDNHLLVVCTAERGLCGGFNSSIVRLARDRANALTVQGKTVQFVCVGKKGFEQLRRQFEKKIIEVVDLRSVRQLGFENAEQIGRKLLDRFASGEFDVCTLFFSRFKSVLTQVPTAQQLIPAQITETSSQGALTPYEYEPEHSEILATLLPRNVNVQIFRALLENAASEQGARMSAMDNATRNAGEMIKKKTMQYNRSRQAMITKELIEIISGAEAL